MYVSTVGRNTRQNRVWIFILAVTPKILQSTTSASFVVKHLTEGQMSNRTWIDIKALSRTTAQNVQKHSPWKVIWTDMKIHVSVAEKKQSATIVRNVAKIILQENHWNSMNSHTTVIYIMSVRSVAKNLNTRVHWHAMHVSQNVSKSENLLVPRDNSCDLLKARQNVWVEFECQYMVKV